MDRRIAMGSSCVFGPGQLHGSETANKAGGGNDTECWWDVYMTICVDRIKIEDTAREENPFRRRMLEHFPDRGDPGPHRPTVALVCDITDTGNVAVGNTRQGEAEPQIEVAGCRRSLRMSLVRCTVAAAETQVVKADSDSMGKEFRTMQEQGVSYPYKMSTAACQSPNSRRCS
jgi:hypothetical protein